MNINDPKFKPEINEQLQSFLPELTSEEFDQLKENCKADPFHERLPPVQIWSSNDTIVDGHHQYKLRKRLGLKIRYALVDFASLGEVTQYMIRAQFGRRNLNPSQRSMLAIKARRFTRGRPRADAREAGTSLDELAAMADVSKRIVSTAAKVEDNGAASVVNAVVNGEFTVSDAEQVVQLPKEVQDEIVEEAKASGQTLAATKRVSEARSRSGQEIVNSRVRKEALSTFGKLWRLLRGLGIQKECEDHMEAVEELIRKCDELAEEKNKVPF